MTSNEWGKTAEYRVMRNLVRSGKKVRMTNRGPFDMVVDGKNVEIKAARPQMHSGILAWVFNIHRHGILNETADFYIFRLDGIPGHKAAVHMLYESPIGLKTVHISLRSLVKQKFHRQVQAFDSFVRGY